MNFKNIIKNIKYEILIGEIDKDIKGITCDSRKCGEDYIFVAIRGFESDGHDFIENAIKNGASVIFYEAGIGVDFSKFARDDLTFVKVKDTRKIYSYICNIFYGNPSEKIKIIGITGTNGKTTVSYLLEKILSNTGVIGTVNYRLGNEIIPCNNTTPEPSELNYIIDRFINKGAENIIMEVSSHGIDLNRVSYINFDIGVFTNLTSEHLDYHKTMENYFNAKKRFFTEILPASNKKTKFAVINTDDDYGKKLLKDIDYDIITYSMEDKNADVFAESFTMDITGCKITVSIDNKSYNVKTNLIGEHNISNILSVMGVARCLNLNMEQVSKSLSSKINIPGRLERVKNNRNVFVDYAHTADALKNVLTSLNKIKQNNSKIITVFGCGGDRDKSKRPKMGYIASKLSDFIIVTSDNPRTENPVLIIDNIMDGVKRALKKGLIEENSYRVIPDRRDAIKMAINIAKDNDIVLIAGKGHEDYQIIGKEKIHFDDKETALEFLK